MQASLVVLVCNFRLFSLAASNGNTRASHHNIQTIFQQDSLHEKAGLNCYSQCWVNGFIDQLSCSLWDGKETRPDRKRNSYTGL